MVVKQIQLVIELIHGIEIVLFRTSEFLLHMDREKGDCLPILLCSHLCIIIGDLINGPPFIVIIGKGKTACIGRDLITLSSPIPPACFHLVIQFFLGNDIDDTTGGLAAVHHRTAAVNHFYPGYRTGRNIFQIIKISPVDRGTVNHNHRAIFNAAHHDFAGHGRIRRPVGPHAGGNNAIQIS